MRNVDISVEIRKIKRHIKSLLNNPKLVNSPLGSYRYQFLIKELDILKEELQMRKEERVLERKLEYIENLQEQNYRQSTSKI